MACRNKSDDDNIEKWQGFLTWSDLFVCILDDTSQKNEFQNEVQVAGFLLPSKKQTASELETRLRNIRNWKRGTRPQKRLFQVLTKQLEIKSGTALHDRWLHLYGASTTKPVKPHKEKSSYGSFTIGAMLAVIVVGVVIFGIFQSFDTDPNAPQSAEIDKRIETVETTRSEQTRGGDRSTASRDINTAMVDRFAINGLRLGAAVDTKNRYYAWNQIRHFPSVSWVRPLENGHVAFATYNNRIDGRVIAIARSFVIRELEDEELFEFLKERFGHWDGLVSYKPYWKEKADIDIRDCFFHPSDSQVSILDTHASLLARLSYKPTGYITRHHPIKLNKAERDCGILVLANSNAIGLVSLLIVDTQATSELLSRKRQKEQEAHRGRKSAEKSTINFD